MHRCPYCQSETLGITDLSEGEIKIPVSFISCTNCKATGPSSKNQKEAWENWNLRYTLLTTKESNLVGTIRNCVFCKSKRTKIKSGALGFFVECQKCKSSGPIKKTPQEASNKWNDAK